jgi:hypothetical protein
LKIPEVVGVPLTVIEFPEKEAETPEGRPTGVPMPVAPVVVNVITGDIGLLIHTVGLLEAAETVLVGLTVTVTVWELSQFAPILPVTVYVVVTNGDAVTDAPVVEDKPVAGDHE